MLSELLHLETDSTLHRLGFSYKNTKNVPSKANRKEQEAFLRKYEDLKENLKETEKIYFMDGVQPTHNIMPAPRVHMHPISACKQK